MKKINQKSLGALSVPCLDRAAQDAVLARVSEIDQAVCDAQRRLATTAIMLRSAREQMLAGSQP